MPRGALIFFRGWKWMSLKLQRVWSSITTGVTHRRHRLVLRGHLTRARAQLDRLGLRVPAGVWFCGGCREVLWDADAFLSHTRMHAG